VTFLQRGMGACLIFFPNLSSCWKVLQVPTMAVRHKPSTDLKPGSQKPEELSRNSPSRSEEPVEEFLWNIISINSDFEEMSFAWAQMLGINVHQWMILRGIRELDRGDGVSVKGVSAKLHTDPSFVTTQSKDLEKNGFLRRRPSSEDARVVLMSLTDKACKAIESLYSKHASIRESIFMELSDKELREVNGTLSLLRERFQRAAKRLAAEL
jgi:MarR family transcriptional regulator, organic hydroperoxide resistance regulator